MKNQQKSNKDTLSSWIKKANLKHKNVYDYSLVKYNKSDKKVKIICHKHGVFFQRPQDHIRGNGCPICNASKGEIQVEFFLKENNIKFKRQKTI